MAAVYKVFTLAAGNTCLRDMLKSESDDIQMQLTYLRWRVVGPGIVAKGDSAMAALADGDQFGIGEGDADEGRGRTDACLVYFRPTTGGVDQIFIEARDS